MSKKLKSEIEISQLVIYPIKSCAHIIVPSINVDSFGLQMDRRWMVVDENGRYLSQRELHRMCCIKPILKGSVLILNAVGMQTVEVDVNAIRPVIMKDVTIWSDECAGIDCGDTAANWLSEFLQQNCRLVYFPDEEVRQVDLTYAQKGDKTAFSDGFPLLLISESSLADLNSRLDIPVEMRRFRPNIVVKGCDPFAEDGWKKIQIGNMVLRVVKPCKRCVIPNIDPDTGLRGEEPTKTLLTYRKVDKNIYFGQNVIAEGTGQLEVGMQVAVLA